MKRGAVTAKALRKGAVTSPKLAPKSVIGGKLGPAAVGPGNIGNGAVIASKLAKNSVTNPAIANGVVGTNKLGNGVVTTVKLANGDVTSAKLANGSVTTAKLADDVAPLLGGLRSGQTLRGSFAVGGSGNELSTVIEGQSFIFPLTNTPAASVVNPSTATTAACPGIHGGTPTPEATAGNLCLYVTSGTNLKSVSIPAAGTNRLGFSVEAAAETPTQPFAAYGQWAVTAP